MALKNIIGLDHVVILVRDLDRAAVGWGALGFTLSPRGTHSPQLGSGNYTIMFGEDYVELLGILQETPHNAPSRGFLERRGEGMERAAFTAVDSAAGVEEIRARGLAGIGPIAFGRPVERPDGSQTEAKFRIFQWPIEEAPGGLRIFACQHLTRDAVWMPELQRHANTARRLVRVEILSADAAADAAHMGRLIDRAAEPQDGGTVRVPSGGGRADFVFMTATALAARYPGVPLAGGVAERGTMGGAALVIAVDDLDAAAAAAGSQAVRVGASVCVPPAAANGIVLCFVAD